MIQKKTTESVKVFDPYLGIQRNLRIDEYKNGVKQGAKYIRITFPTS